MDLNYEDIEVAIQRYIDTFSEKTHDADGYRLSELIKQAKGKRSIRKFAEEIGTTPSTLSRLINLQTSEASDELIIKIGIHADKESGVTVEQLMEAHGKVDPVENRRRGIINQERKIRNAVVDTLLEKGFTCTIQCDVQTPYGYYYDFEVENEQIGKWAFDIKLSQPQSILGPMGSGRSMKLFNSIFARLYLECDKYDRVSVVVDRREILEDLKRQFKDLVLKDCVSIIFVTGTTVVEEFVIPNTKNSEVIFETLRKG